MLDMIWYLSATLLSHRSCTGFTILFKDTSTGGYLLPNWFKPGPATVVEGQPLCSLRHLHVLNKYRRAKQPDGKSSQAPQQTEVEHLLQGCVRAHSGAQHKSPLTFPAVGFLDSDLAAQYRWDCKRPPDTAIKFHFEDLKVSLNPSQI